MSQPPDVFEFEARFIPRPEQLEAILATATLKKEPTKVDELWDYAGFDLTLSGRCLRVRDGKWQYKYPLAGDTPTLRQREEVSDFARITELLELDKLNAAEQANVSSTAEILGNVTPEQLFAAKVMAKGILLHGEATGKRRYYDLDGLTLDVANFTFKPIDPRIVIAPYSGILEIEAEGTEAEVMAKVAQIDRLAARFGLERKPIAGKFEYMAREMIRQIRILGDADRDPRLDQIVG